MEQEKKKTSFTEIYDKFLTSVTSDMYMELTELDTYRMLQDLLIKAIPQFEFPRKNINDYTLGEESGPSHYKGADSESSPTAAMVWDEGYFNCELTNEEQEILVSYMIVEWLTQQLVTTENVRMKFSGSDFKFASQANHMAKLKDLVDKYKERAFHLQRLYCRRRQLKNGKFRSTMDLIMTPPTYGYKLEEGSDRDDEI